MFDFGVSSMRLIIGNGCLRVCMYVHTYSKTTIQFGSYTWAWAIYPTYDLDNTNGPVYRDPCCLPSCFDVRMSWMSSKKTNKQNICMIYLKQINLYNNYNYLFIGFIIT